MTVSLVLLPGMDGTGDLFQPLVDELRDDVPALVVRYPVAEPLDYNALTSLARKALPNDRPYVILGESFSGPVAIRLAAERPRGLIGLILCSSFVSNPAGWLRHFKSFVSVAPIGVLARLFGPGRLMGRFQTTALRRRFRSAIAKVSIPVLRGRIAAAMEIDASSELTHIDVPATYIRGTEDVLLSPKAGDEFARRLLGATVVDVVGPHSLALCVPQALGGAIRQFVFGLSQASNNSLERARDG